jgi:hypothetical protein
VLKAVLPVLIAELWLNYEWRRRLWVARRRRDKKIVGDYTPSDMLNANVGSDLAIVAKVRCALKNFVELATFLTSNGVSLRVKGKVYECCVRSSMMGVKRGPWKQNMNQSWKQRIWEWLGGYVTSLMDNHMIADLRSRLGSLCEGTWRGM